MQVYCRVGVVPIIGANKIGIHRPSIEIYESQQGQGGPIDLLRLVHTSAYRQKIPQA